MNRIHKIPLYPIILDSPLSVKGRINAQQINCKTFVLGRKIGTRESRVRRLRNVSGYLIFS